MAAGSGSFGSFGSVSSLGAAAGEAGAISSSVFFRRGCLGDAIGVLASTGPAGVAAVVVAAFTVTVAGTERPGRTRASVCWAKRSAAARVRT
jgi:hypothetical protein